MSRADIVNALLGRPYRLGASGPDAFDCYGLARHLQSALFGRDMPEFSIPGKAGRHAIAMAIAVHPERARWREVSSPVDGGLVTMARHLQGYHIGTWLAEDGGTILHTLETTGVVASRLIELEAEGWRKFRFHRPD